MNARVAYLLVIAAYVGGIVYLLTKLYDTAPSL